MVNVIPLEDEHPHVMGEGCECCPWISWEERADGVLEKPVLVHNAYDCREVAERAEVTVGIKSIGNGNGWGIFDP
jgi:hypothetical protein